MPSILFLICAALLIVALIYAVWTTAFGESSDADTTNKELSTTEEGIEIQDAAKNNSDIINLMVRILFKSPALVVAKTVATDIKILRFFTPIAATVGAYIGSTMAYESFGIIGPLIYMPLTALASLSFYYGPKGNHNRLALLSFWCAPVTAQLMAHMTGYVPVGALVINVMFIIGWVIEFGKEVQKTYFNKG
jgi:Flp pilus assembly protein TadB